MHATLAPRCTWTGLADLRPLVVGFLGRFTSDDGEIEDVAQEALLRAARYRTGRREPRCLRSWLLRIALNVLRDRARRQTRLPRYVTDEEVLDGIEGREAVPGDEPEDARIELDGVVVERARAYRHLAGAIASLDANDRAALRVWYAASGGRGRVRSSSSAARALAKVRVFRARRRLSAALVRRFTADASIAWPGVAPAIPEPVVGPGARCAGTASTRTVVLDATFETSREEAPCESCP